MIPSPHRIIDDINWLLDAWDPLREARIKGTPRPWKMADTTPEQRAQADARARAEKTERGAFVLGESPAPIHLDVLDQILDVGIRARQLAIQHAEAVGDAPALVYLSRVQNPDAVRLLQYLTTTTTRLDDNDLLTHTGTVLRGLRVETAKHFAEVVEGQRLKAYCPWCDGNETLKFRLIGPRHAPEIVVRCESGACEPPEADCGCWTGRGLALPTWRLYEWEWLAGRINYHNDKSNPQAGGRKQGTVYFAKTGAFIKIGWTGTLLRRPRDLEVDEVLATMPGTPKDARSLHKTFDKYQAHHGTRREYFHPDPHLLEYITGLHAIKQPE